MKLLIITLALLLSFGLFGSVQVFAVTFPINQSVTPVPDTGSGNTWWFGYEIRTNYSNMKITNCNRNAISNAPLCAVLNSSCYLICIWDITTTASCDLPYAGNYTVMAGNNGSSYTFSYKGGGAVFPQQQTVMNYTVSRQSNLGAINIGTQYSCGSDATTPVNFDSITFNEQTVGAFIIFNSQSPANNTYSHNTSPEFIFNTTYISSGYNVTLYINGSTYGVNVSPTNNSLTTVVVNTSLVANANYAWYFNATNGVTSNVSSTYNYYIAGNLSGGSCNLSCLTVTNGCRAYTDGFSFLQ